MARVGISGLALAVALTLAVPAALANHRAPRNGPNHSYGDMVDYDLAFPVVGQNRYSNGFYSRRGSGVHHAIDIMADKMTPVIAAHDGTIKSVGSRCCSLHIRHSDGWESVYIHLNNDTPGTDDGQGWGIAPGISPGVSVKAGQVVGWVGDSGNAEGTAPHLHFELYDPDGVAVNPYDALRGAEGKAPSASCSGPNVGSLGTLLEGTGLLKLGSRGEPVTQLQRFLSGVGYNTGPVDGVLGQLTSGAIRAFQEGRGINPDGIVGSQTRAHLRTVASIVPAIPVLDHNQRIIRPGYRGDDIHQLQDLLKVAGYDPGGSDGVYGPKTEGAVASFQRDYGNLTVDGKVGSNTRNALAAFLGLGDFKACS